MGKTSRKRIKLSYVLPTYNRVEYLGECLWTLVQQRFPKDEYEVIVVDDGSTDSTKELVDYYRDEYPNFFYYKLSHEGVEKARNFGNCQARANIIAVCDSDDLYHPLRTRITLNYFKKNPHKDLMNGSYKEINHRGRVIKSYKAKPFNRNDFLAGKVFYFCHDNCAYKKSEILKTPYRTDGEGTDDFKLVSDWVKAGHKFGYTGKELCLVRTLNNGIMGALRAQRGVKLPYV